MGFPALRADHPHVPWFLCSFALLTSLLSARPYAGSWNDGSRLASVETLGDHGTLAIDDSIFCRPTEDVITRGYPPYAPDDADNLTHGTRDKLFINGRYYSEKPAVISVLMAGVYRTARGLGLPAAAQRPDLFCLTLTIMTSGLAYLVCLLALHRLGRVLRLPDGVHFLWLGSFALSTVVLAYTRHVNNHILLLAVLTVACLQLVLLAKECETGMMTGWRLIGLGTLAGIGFNLDFGSGPLLVGGMLLLVAWRCAKRKQEAVLFMLACAPWVIAGVGINYAVGGTLKPANMVPEYMSWPGSPFTSENLTGFSRHDPPGLIVYGLSLLFGKKGILTHNLPLLLLLPALMSGLVRRSPLRAELLFGLGWCVCVWLMYSVLSNNFGGGCLSIRWFVPFLAPGWLLLGLYLKEQPEARPYFLALSLWGLVLGLLMWRVGPWTLRMAPLLWPVVAAALLSCYLCHRSRQRRVMRESAARERPKLDDSRAAA